MDRTNTAPVVHENSLEINSSDEKPLYLIYTDGSSLGNSPTSNAGWACLFIKERKLKFKHMQGTNNQAELTAILFALWYTWKVFNVHEHHILIKTDSNYAMNVVTGNFKSKANKELIMKVQGILKKVEDNGNDVEFEHVDAHTGGDSDDAKNNDLVDRYAKKAASTVPEAPK